MRHRVKGKKLGRTKSHRAATLRALITGLLENKRIHTTEAKAKALRPYAEKLITKARKAYIREQQGLLPDGMKHDLATRRELANHITKKTVIEDLFDEILPEISDRPGGYTRIVKTGVRRGDAGSSALIELVDYNREQTEAVSIKPKKKRKQTPKPKEEIVADVVEEPKVTEETEETTDETSKIIESAESSSDETVADATDSEASSDEGETEEASSESNEESSEQETEVDSDSESIKVVEHETSEETTEEPVAEVKHEETKNVETPENSEEKAEEPKSNEKSESSEDNKDDGDSNDSKKEG